MQRAILDYLATVPGVVAFRVNSGAMFGEHKGKGWAVRFNGMKGCSDILGWWSRLVTDGVHVAPSIRVASFLAVEAKSSDWMPPWKPGREMNRWLAQRDFLDRVTAAGGIALVARSLDDVRAVIR